MSTPAAVVFDHDGVLVDSEPIALDVWCRILDERGVPYQRSEVESLVGLTDPDAHARMADRPGMPALAEFMDEFEYRRDNRFVDELRPFSDAWEAVRTLAGEGIPLGVATNATRALLELSLEITGLGRYFDATAARTDVPHGKPAPDVYLEAARRLGIEAHRCLAIEDSATGAEAAAAAGMRVVTVARQGIGPEGFASIASIDAGLILTWMGRA
jgi:HAD superfamily hydrolase (TIGR01509 family)